MVAAITLIFILFVILVYISVLRPKILSFHELLKAECNLDLIFDGQAALQLREESKSYVEVQDSIVTVRRNVRSLYFPIPKKSKDNLPGESIIHDCFGILDENSFIFTGAEQFLLTIFPPEQVGNCIIYATNSILTHSSEATLESLVALKTSILDGVVNIQNPEIQAECLKQFTHAVFEHLKDPDRLQSFLEAIDHHHAVGIIHPFINFDTIRHTLEPAMHLDSTMRVISHSYANHAIEASKNVAHHVHGAIVPHPGGHVPVLTIVLSGIREIKLLNDDKTTIENSIKNGLLDVGGTWGGAAAGAKVGAVIGSFIPVAGTAVGGLVGGIFGAIAGRWGTNKIKYKPLRKAQENFQSGCDSMYRSNHLTAKNCVATTRKEAIMTKRNFYVQLGEIQGSDPSLKKLSQISDSIIALQQEKIASLSARISKMKANIFSYTNSGRELIRATEDKLSELRKKWEFKSSPQIGYLEKLQLVLSTPAISTSGYLSLLDTSYIELKTTKEDLSAKLLLWSLQGAEDYKKSLAHIHQTFSQQGEVFINNYNFWKGKVSDLHQDVKSEADKLGIK